MIQRPGTTPRALSPGRGGGPSYASNALPMAAASQIRRPNAAPAPRPGWSPTNVPPKHVNEKDQLIEKLVHDNEVLMKEVAELDAQLRQAVQDRDEAVAAKANALRSLEQNAMSSETSERLVHAMEGQLEVVRGEREELSRQHAADRSFLNGMFQELEAQLALARTEREELHARAERERRAAAKRIKELEEQLSAGQLAKDKLRETCDREKEVLAKQFEQRVAGLRLEKEQAKLDKALMRRLEADLADLKTLSQSVLGPIARGDHRRGEWPDVDDARRPDHLDFSDPEVEAAAAFLRR